MKLLLISLLLIFIPSYSEIKANDVIVHKDSSVTRAPLCFHPYVLNLDNRVGVYSNTSLDNVDIYIFDKNYILLFFENINELKQNEIKIINYNFIDYSFFIKIVWHNQYVIYDFSN